MHQRLPQAVAAAGALSLTCPMQALLPSQVPSGSALAKLRQQELDTLQGKGKGPSFEPKLWDRVYQVSQQVWQSKSTKLAAPLARHLDACCLLHQNCWQCSTFGTISACCSKRAAPVCHVEDLGQKCPDLRPER